jgi:peptide/nickel transport system substrate-binding protein
MAGAAALLDEAGWTDNDGDGIRECNGCETAEEGTPMSMEFAIYAEYGEELELAQQFIGESLRELGFDVQLQIIEGTVMWSPAEDGGTEANGNFDLDMWDDGYPGTDPTDYQMWTFYYSEATPEEGGWNVGRWVNEDFDTWLDEAYTLDEDYRKEVFCEMAVILEEELPEILLWSAIEGHGVSKRIVGAQPSVNDPLTWNIADWTLTE